MYDDILGKINDPSDTDEKILNEIEHDQWCMVYCIKICNSLVGVGLLENKSITIITEKGMRLLNQYWGDKEPNDEEVKKGMEMMVKCGLI